MGNLNVACKAGLLKAALKPYDNGIRSTNGGWKDIGGYVTENWQTEWREYKKITKLEGFNQSSAVGGASVTILKQHNPEHAAASIAAASTAAAPELAAPSPSLAVPAAAPAAVPVGGPVISHQSVLVGTGITVDEINVDTGV